MKRVALWMIVLYGLAVVALPEGAGNAELTCILQLNGVGPSVTTDPRTHLHLVLLSNRDGIDIYEDWNSWGYFARSFTASDSHSRRYEITRVPPDGWDRNFPSVVTLNRGQFLITDIYLCDGTWRVSPRMSVPSGQELRVIGRFKQARDRLALALGNPWVGNIKSAPIELSLSESCIARLNAGVKR